VSRLAVCAIFKNEARYLLEWIAYHHAVGVAHFFLYDNESSDGGAELIRASPLAPLVTITPWPYRPGQLPAYRHFIAEYAVDWEWVAFIDLDEFILPLQERSIPAALAGLPGFAGVLVQWRVFGPSGWAEPPDGLVIEQYTLRTADDFPANRHVKTIARCSELVDVTFNPHEFVLSGNTCDPTGRAVPNLGIQPAECHQAMVINHYQTRSRRDWAEKIARGSAMFDYTEPKYPAELVDHYEAMSTVPDTAIHAFLPRVRELLAGVAEPEAEPERLWLPQPPSGYVHRDARALVFQPWTNGQWLAALRGPFAPGRVDPAFLTDSMGRLRLFASMQAACAACELALAAGDHDQAPGEPSR
jgi:hypothetical protein